MDRSIHDVYIASAALGDLVARFGIDEILGGTRHNIALMIEQLVGWNVHDTVLARVTRMGAEETYRALQAQDLYLLRSALPDQPLQIWLAETDIDAAEALRNACLRLLAHHENLWPTQVLSRLQGPMLADVGRDAFGRTLAGFALLESPSPLQASYCAVTAAESALDGDADIALYSGAGIDGVLRPLLSFFHRPEGWSTLGTGADPTRRIFQKGTIVHYFLPPATELAGPARARWQMLRAGHFDGRRVLP